MANGYVSHFHFWRTGQQINVVDAKVSGQFGDLGIKLQSILLIGNPAAKNGQPVDKEYDWIHLVAYTIVNPPPFQKDVFIANQFTGQEQWSLGSPELLLVPAFKVLQPPPPADPPKAGPHFLCYRVTKFPNVVPGPVNIADQFQKKDVTSLQPRYLGIPVDKNGEGYWNEDVHLAMYQYSSQVPNPPLGTVYTRDQFDERKIDPGGSFLLGVPSKKWL
jgi:hypothetical protein